MSFAYEFALAFEIQPLKVAFSFKMPIFQSIPVLNGLSKSIALVQKSKKKVCLHFQTKLTKQTKFKSFTGSSLTL